MSYDIMFQQAIQLHEQGRFGEAEHLYRQILETAPDNADILNLLGLIAQSKGIHNEAVELFYKAVRQAPEHAPFYFNLALSLDAWGKPFEAIDSYLQAVKLNPSLKEAYNNIGNIYKNLGRTAEAENAYNQAVNIDKDYSEPQINLAMLRQNIESLKDLAQKYPNDALSSYFLSSIYYNEGEYSTALKYISQADKISPNNDSIKNLFGLIQLALGQITDAKINFEKALDYNPRSVPALINLGNIETNLGNFKIAEAHYKHALELNPQELNAHINYANLLYLQKRLPEALEEYRAAVIINPNIPEVSNNLGIILKDIEEYEEALGLFFNAFSRNPEQEEYSINIAETLVLLHRQNADTAQKIAEKWEKENPENIFAKHTNASFKGETLVDNKVYTEKLFDHFADNYELVLQNVGYGVVRGLRDLTGDVKGTVVDLGCGSGLAGEAYKTVFTTLVGVDISEKMLEKARNKGIYKELIKSDILEYLYTKPKADLFIAADVFCYFGDLEPIIKEISNQPLAFSIEELLDSNENFKLFPSGRYKHNPQNIEKLLNKYHFKDIKQQPAVIRQENGQDVKGIIWYAQ